MALRPAEPGQRLLQFLGRGLQGLGRAVLEAHIDVAAGWAAAAAKDGDALDARNRRDGTAPGGEDFVGADPANLGWA